MARGIHGPFFKRRTMKDTIAAVSTAYGEGGIGIVRISGDAAEQILTDIFVPAFDVPGKEGHKTQRQITVGENRKLIYGTVTDPKTGEKIDEALAVFMKGPATYTREDIVEINCHGSVISLRKTLALVLSMGARPAENGEFTKRAFINGRLDLSQAEAVIDIIKAKTDKGFGIAMDQLSGKYSKEISDIRNRIKDILVQIAVNIDYPDEDIEKIMYEDLKKSVSQIGDMIGILIDSANTGRIIKEGLDVVIVGRPNVGKSSLLNALLRESRAIVTEIPGTTRDTIEETISLKGIPVKITDTAGIHYTDDHIERIGIKKSKSASEKADLIIFMLDASQRLTDEDREIMGAIIGKKTIVLINKTDLEKKLETDEIKKTLSSCRLIETSLLSGEGLSEIEEEIEKLVYGGHVKQQNSLLVTNARHETLLKEAARALLDAEKMISNGGALEFIEVDIKRSYDFLGEITGETVSDDIIEEVFSRFCLGK